MSLFGSSPPADSPSNTSAAPSRSLFDEGSMSKSGSNSLFTDDGLAGAESSPWDMPTPRKKQSRADVVRNLLSASDVPEPYIETFDTVVREDGSGGRVNAGGIAKLFAAARLGADQQAQIMAMVVPAAGGDIAVGRGEFNVLLALIALSQEGDHISLDTVDERRRNLPLPKLAGLTAAPVMPPVSELAAKPPQAPATPVQDTPSPPSPPPPQPATLRRPPMDFPEPEDPWNSPDVHKGHAHTIAESPSRTNGASPQRPAANGNGNGNGHYSTSPSTAIAGRTMSSYTSAAIGSERSSGRQDVNTGTSPGGGWGGYFDGNTTGGGFSEPSQNNQVTSPFGGASGGRDANLNPAAVPSLRPAVSGRSGSSVEENVVITLMPEKEGLFMFQHHNYEVASVRRGSKVIRRYSDFVWLLDCLHKRYPFRALPLLPPKRVAVNGNHFSNDGAFIEKRRRGLGRFLNALVRHPILSQEQLIIMFLTVPTELAVWRKQATISVQDEFSGRALPPNLEDSLPPTLEAMFDKTRSGIRRSAELYINICNVMDRLVKRSEGVAADHARIAMSLTSLTETSADTYASDTNDVPLLNDGLTSMSRHLRTCQTLLEDESKAWEEGVLEDLKRQRDALVSIRDLFDRRERLDKDNIPYLERRIQTNETKLASLRSKPDGMVKPGEIEKVVESILKDKESIVNQHNRSIFVKECIRDELIYFQTTQFHVSRWNQDWAQERVKYSEMLADNWRRLLDELDGMPLGD
ncbi:sorting nexin mvp-1 [Colletotrichum scovillei]|uniref:Sorting nexin MVP1 n=1 Tax=Colletotrichum scovillei TaxID=1209932 RepID=A0A9P7QQN4_9PEZI|nr:sorting nexin mvp-1 [Colletotrichum scovillei]KAF4775229.1 sorting nexin mvp-1 [Colletotrichum scovillei]KAG7039061.1 sorting nexin mvp-1 [Colletotrichum scovillei]KAG7041240.1 sorting nexin mvp-1 [Colletotrichum scovillei]KAG7061272.1 sorting nexin mvp-1 [Colletotrichum scovillei]